MSSSFWMQWERVNHPRKAGNEFSRLSVGK